MNWNIFKTIDIIMFLLRLFITILFYNGRINIC